MTNFEKLKSMSQKDAVEYLENGICKVHTDTCEECPFYTPEVDGYCINEVFAGWLEEEEE